MTIETVPWPYSMDHEAAKELDVPLVRNRPCFDGFKIGYRLDELCQDSIDAGRPDGRCHDCAFLRGTDPNGCVATLGDAVKCLVEGEPFYCHTKSGHPVCGGFALLAGKVVLDSPEAQHE